MELLHAGHYLYVILKVYFLKLRIKLKLKFNYCLDKDDAISHLVRILLKKFGAKLQTFRIRQANQFFSPKVGYCACIELKF